MALMNPLAGEEKKEHLEANVDGGGKKVDFEEAGRRSSRAMMDVYTGEYIKKITN